MTGDHLIFTRTGLRAARELVVGDVVFGANDAECVVSALEPLPEGNYFGLNCLRSVVMVNGVKASTFGRLHTLPALWMHYVGSVVGVQRASRMGDALVSLVARFW